MWKNKLIRDTSLTTLSSYSIKFIALLRGFIVARILDPSLYGYFSGLSLILLYNSQAHLGILHGLNRNLSLTKGAAQNKSFVQLKNNGITAILFLSLFFAGLIILYSFLFQEKYSNDLIWGFRVYAVLSVLFHFQYIYHSLLRVDHKFREIIISNFLFSITNFFLVLVFAYYFKFYGVLISFLISLSLQGMYLYYITNLDFKFSFNINVIKNLFLDGAPISFIYFIDVILNSIDRIMIAIFMTSRELGFYGIGLALSSEFLLQIPNSISYVIYPRLLENFGKYNSYDNIRDLFENFSTFISFIMSIIVGLLFILVDYLIPYILPRYTEAIPVAKILIFSTYFISVNQLAIRVIITTKKTFRLAQFQIIIIILNISLNYYAIKYNLGIEGIALATAFSYFIFSICITHYTLEKFYLSFINSIKEQIKLYFPLFYIVLSLFLISYFSISEPEVTKNLKYDLISFFIKTSSLLLLFSPFILINIKKLRLLKY
ncbi:MAG: oligosaccharide flippase family protein [Desulfobulbaceae bacterium]|nr:oligosaccharide flippase family protein [Desulfobulbaceae bacterium]